MRPNRLVHVLAPLALVASLAACQDPDVGQRCRVPRDPLAQAVPDPATITGDYLETGNAACDDLVCIVSPAVSGGRYNDCPGGECGYCSKPCVSDQDCYRSETGLSCRQMVLDPAFMLQLEKTDPELAARYLADIQFSSYCAVAPP
jgi:hypothetical protein